jgi:hypothetical protein
MENNFEYGSDDFRESSGRKRSGGSGVIVFLSVLAVILAIAGALLLREVLQARYDAQMKDLVVERVSNERNEMLRDLDEISAKYDQLAVEYKELDSLFKAERVRVNQLRAQLRSGTGPVEGGASFRAQIEELQAQVEDYRLQLEMLQAEKSVLENENSQIRTTLAQTTARNTELVTRNDDLEQQLEKASVLSISNLELTPLRTRRRGDEPTDRAKRTDKMRVCFTVNQNLVAQRGNTDFFIRLVDPRNTVMATSSANTLEFEGEAIQYSIKRTVNYQNASQDVCVVWDQQEKFDKGYYNVVVFWNGMEVGYKLFQLN